MAKRYRHRTAPIPSYTIERGRGSTYRHTSGVVVYKHDTYPPGSVLAGQHRRSYIEAFDSIEEAQAQYPQATAIEGTTYHPPDLSHLPNDGDY